MGLLSALSTAVSGLNINQKNLDVLSQNIANANTPNYSTQTLNQAANFIAGQGAGVIAQSITRKVDEFLTAEVQSQTSANSSASTVQNYYSQVENLLGQPGTTGSLDQTVSSFFTALQTLANSPSVSSETTAVNAAVSVSNQVSGLANSLQSLRLQSDTDINNGVNAVNADIQTLFSTNAALERASATGQSTGGLLDQRDTALADIAQYMDIKPSYNLDGEVTLSTTNGVTLLTPTNISKLTYTPATSTQSFINNANMSPLQVVALDNNGNAIGSPVTLVTGGASSSVTTSLTGGKIQGLLQVRDTVIPNILSQLDQLAGSLRDGVNAINNAGTSFPPPNSYTGDRLISASSVSQYSGKVQIALLDANGNPVPSPYSDESNGQEPLTLDLSNILGSTGTNGVLSTGDIVNAINQYYGAPQNKVELGNLNNIQLQMLSNSVPDSGNTASVDFNLNNLTGTTTPFYVTGMTVVDNNGNAASATTTQPLITPTTYQATSNGTVTVQASGAGSLTAGEKVYLSFASPTVVGGATLTSGYYTVSGVGGNSFDVSVAGASASATSVTANAADRIYPPMSSVAGGATSATGANGSFTLTGLNTSPTPTFYTVTATVGTLDASGNVVTSNVTYRIPNNTANVRNNLIGASSASAGNLIAPSTNRPQVTATLVDANGNPLQLTNGSYGNQQGYLKITANNASYTLSINELDSKQLGLPNATIPQAGTNQGFSQYFGLNDFFNVNNLTSTGDTTANSAINLSVQSRIVSNPSLISTGTLSLSTQPTGPSAAPNYTYILAPGDNSISQKLAALATSSISFLSAGGMPPSSTTLAQYAGQIIAKTSSDSSDATNTATDSQTLLAGYTTRAQSVSGVNLDQELANTVIYQNAYSASTRVITVVSTMFQELLGIIQ